MITKEDEAYIILADAKISPKSFSDIIDRYDNPETFIDNVKSGTLEDINPRQLNTILKSIYNIEKIKNDLEKYQISFLHKGNKKFPSRLLNIEDAPYCIFYKGDISLLDKKTVAIVGTRKPSYYGKKMAKNIAKTLSSHNVCVVSGFAVGIDTCAHESAVENIGSTIAVCGCGLCIDYPSTNRDLKKRILNNSGLIISEYTPFTEPTAYHFPFRNRIIAAISQALVFIEGALKSGGMHTVNRAVDYDVKVYAVPGNLDSELSRGPNYIINEGIAQIYFDDQDILEYVGAQSSVQNTKEVHESAKDSLDDLQFKIYEQIKLSPRSFDEIVELLSISVDEASSALSFLEILGYIKKAPGNIFEIL